MSASSANPDALIDYSASMYNEGQAVLDHLGRADITEKLDAVRTGCSQYVQGEIPDVNSQVSTATLGAEELDVWVGAVGQAFLVADTSGAAGTLHVEDDAVIANLPPGLADPPAETRRKLDEGQRFFDDLMKATDDRDHDRIQQFLGTLKDRQGDTAFMAGFAMKVDKLGGTEALQQRLKDGMRPKKHGGFFGPLIDFGEGLWDSVWGTLNMIAGLTTQVFFDPKKWAENWSNLGAGLWQGVTHPVEFLKTLIDVDGFRDNPNRWLGSFVPDLAATVLSGGAGAAAKGARGLSLITDLAETARTLERVSKGLKVTGGLEGVSTTIRLLDPGVIHFRDALRKTLIDKGVAPEKAEALANRIAAGKQFDLDNAHRYRFNQLRLLKDDKDAKGYWILDSYDPARGEIVSRKLVQLDKVKPATARSYIDEAVKKYPDGAQVAATPTVLKQERFPGEIAGETLRGKLILEVPSQAEKVPKEVLDYATHKGVTIRTTEGKELNIVPKPK